MIPPDVPIHRASVGAMGWMGNQHPVSCGLTKPYVYRGTGVDQFPETEPPPKPKPKPKPKRKPKPKPKPKPRRRSRARPAARWVDRGPRVIAPTPTTPSSPAVTAAAGATDEPWRDPELDRIAALPRPLRPAPGWRPTTGADLEELIEEIGL